jgi:3-hydroxymyristoyl/3-hydroxydecanoyl-(acyl carrier protein) dehydratase
LALCRVAGVLQVEAMAQLAGLVMLDPEDTAAKGLFFFGGIEGCRFRKPVVPGDVLVRAQCGALALWRWCVAAAAFEQRLGT